MTVAHHHKKQAYHNPHTSMGAAGHWVKTAGILAPLLIPELTKDSAKQMRWVRIASIATALVSEGLWTHKVHKERQHTHEKNTGLRRTARLQQLPRPWGQPGIRLPLDRSLDGLPVQGG